VLFHSKGGLMLDAVEIGHILRERGMVASVGRTVPENCRIFSNDDVACQRLIASGAAVKARLRNSEGQCHSACVFALVGAAVRRVPSDVMLGVHSSRIIAKLPDLTAKDQPNARKFTPADAHSAARQYLALMGVSPELQDIAAKVDTRRIYVLSREEIARFGVETRGFYETAWLPYQRERESIEGLMKSVTDASAPGSDKYESAELRLECLGSFGRLIYRRILPSDLKHRPIVDVVLADNKMSLGRGSELPRGGIVWATVASFQLLAKAVEKPAIDVVERYSPFDRPDAKTVRFSTDGLPAAIARIGQRCSGRT
jgi:hypothetical protein